MSALIKPLSDASFQADVVEATIPVLVDFWAPWCGPCKAIGPILEELATTYQGKIQIAKMSVDENQQVPATFGIRSIPTLIIFKAGKPVATLSGARPKAQLAEFIEQNL